MALTKITTSVVAVNSLTAANIADNSIDATKIANNQILARHIAAGSLTDHLGTLPSATISGNLVVDTTTLVVDSSNNRVGVGVASPNAPLHVGGESYFNAGTRHYTYDDQANYWSLYTNTDDTFRFNYNGAGADEVVINTSGKVGIGTTSPNLKLHVEESTDDTWIADFKHTHANAYGLRVDLSGTTSSTRYALGVYTGGGTGMFVRNNGQVGVGTNAPSQALHVAGAGSMILNDSTNWSYLRLKSPNTNGGYIQFADADDDDVGQIFYYHGSGGDYMSFTTNAAERMRINSTGNVIVGGISDSAAGGKFQVQASKSLTAGIPLGVVTIEDTASMAEGVGGSIAFTGAYLSDGTKTSLASIEASKTNGTSGNYGGELLFKTRVHGGNNVEQMRITENYVIPKMNFHYANNDIYAVSTTGDEHSGSSGVMMLKQQISVTAGSKIIVWYDSGQILNNNQGGNGINASNPQIAIYVSTNSSAPSRGTANMINGNTDHTFYPAGDIGSARIKMNGMGATGTLSTGGTYYIYMYGGSYNSGSYTFNYQNSSSNTRGSSIIWAEVKA